MEIRRRMDRRVRPPTAASVRPLFSVWAACLVVLIVVGTQRQVPIEDLLLDPSAVDGNAWYGGMLTLLGVLGWSVAVCFCSLTSFVTRLGDRPQAARVFRNAALFFGFLLFDDLFLLHSSVAPLIGLSKSVVLLMEMAFAAWWLATGFAELIRTRWLMLALAFAAFGGSLVVDAVIAPMSGLGLLVEDGCKILGVAGLATWAVMTAVDVIRSVVASASMPEELVEEPMTTPTQA